MDKKLTVQEIADIIVEMSEQYTIAWFKVKKVDMDKSLWGALHMGFITGMQTCGYTEKEMDQALKLAQKELSE